MKFLVEKPPLFSFSYQRSVLGLDIFWHASESMQQSEVKIVDEILSPKEILKDK